MGDSIESICSFSAPFLFASAVNHRCRYINDFKTRRDTIKRYYARVLSHASFIGPEDFIWDQQSCYPSDFPQYPQDTGAQHATTACVCVGMRVRFHNAETRLMRACKNAQVGYANRSM